MKKLGWMHSKTEKLKVRMHIFGKKLRSRIYWGWDDGEPILFWSCFFCFSLNGYNWDKSGSCGFCFLYHLTTMSFLLHLLWCFSFPPFQPPVMLYLFTEWGLTLSISCRNFFHGYSIVLLLRFPAIMNAAVINILINIPFFQALSAFSSLISSIW